MQNHRLPALVIATLIGGGGMLLSLTGCGSVTSKHNEQYQDSRIHDRYKPYVTVYDNADGFSNVSEFCDASGNLVIVPFHNSDPYTAVAVSPKDPACAQQPKPSRYFHQD